MANIKDRIPASSGGIIHGSYTVESAEDLALVLRAGALPAEIKYLEERTSDIARASPHINQHHA